MKTVIIGAGRMGRRHVEVVRRLGLELVGICDINPDSLAQAEAEYGIGRDKLFQDADEMLRLVQPACAIVATTATSHCSYTCMAAEKGVKLILVEKPMACSLSECDRMIAACKAAGAKLAVNHPIRMQEQFLQVRDIVHSAAFGGLTSVTIVGGNFGFAMNGTHYFEMFRFLTGEYLETVAAWFSPGAVANPRGPQYEDRAGSLRATTASGKRLYFEIGADQGHGSRIVMAGRYGQLVIDDITGSTLLVTREEQYRQMPSTRYGLPAVERSWQAPAAEVIGPSAAVLNALLGGGNYPSGDDGKAAVAALVGAYHSAENGNIGVRIDQAALDTHRVFPWA